MTGGLMQLVGKGAQDQLVLGNPSFTHFKSVYKRHTDFAMEHFRLVFKTTNLNLPDTGSLTLRAKVERYAQLLHDCYLTLTLPNIYSPVSPITKGAHTNVNANATAVGYEFQWVKNIGYNMINYVAIVINGQEIVRHTGEWMKIYAALKFDANKKAILDQMTGNIKELYDPANAFDRTNQYPHAISTSSTSAEPSINGRVLRIPLHFWFCENVGTALPLVALQQSEVEIIVELKNLYQLFTVIDVRDNSSTFGTRISPDLSSNHFRINKFLSPPLYSNPTAPINTVNNDLKTWKLDPFIEANYIFLSDDERAHIARSDQTFIITQIDAVQTNGQYGPTNDLELTMKNLCTRIVWVGQRSDRILQNDFDNYTNWSNPNIPPIDSTGTLYVTQCFSSGVSQGTAVSQKDLLLESSVVIDGKDRFSSKDTTFFSEIQNYRHHTGKAITDIPGIYAYSFSLSHDTMQPSGHINGSMFNKTILRNTYVQPPLTAPNNLITTVCVLKSTANSPNPTVVPDPNVLNLNTGKPLYAPGDLITVVSKGDAQTLEYSYNVRAYVESYNYLRVMGGIANVVFSS
jgi:hypothetical protein